MKEYHKIHSIFKRDSVTKKFITGDFSLPEFDYLQDLVWIWDEKIDGTNIRVYWDDEKRIFAGRTDRASIPGLLMQRLEELFPLEKLKAIAPQGMLFGEGYGKSIQNGGGYLPDRQDFILFDVDIGDWQLQREDVVDVASKLGIPVTPLIGSGTLLAAIGVVSFGFISRIGNVDAEGLVLRPKVPLYNRKGERIIAKIKTKDFR